MAKSQENGTTILLGLKGYEVEKVIEEEKVYVFPPCQNSNEVVQKLDLFSDLEFLFIYSSSLPSFAWLPNNL